jgi:hypothetical protein
MRERWIFLSAVALLVLCVLLAGLLVSMDENDQAAGQQADTQDQQGQQANQQASQDQQEGQSTDQQAAGGGQSGQGGRSLADLERALHGQVEIYHGAELDTSEEATRQMNETGEWVLLTREASGQVTRFYDNELRRVKDLAREEIDGGVSYSFHTGQGQAVTIDVVQAGSTRKEGTRITIAIKG